MPGGNPGIPEADSGNHIWARRDLLSLLASGAILSCFGVLALSLVRYLFPRVLFEPPSKFKAGYPREYAVGVVDTRWKKKHRVWVIRNKDGFYSILAICTHLGCTPNWMPAAHKFKCPCHGSGYTITGINIEGPAPRPMDHVKIGLADDGQILIDTAVHFRYELGQWDDPGAFLSYPA